MDEVWKKQHLFASNNPPKTHSPTNQCFEILFHIPAKMENPENESYVIINNIPKDYHTSHLRSFFSAFVESSGFLCFHFRHRPEVQKPLHDTSSELCRRVTKCCVVRVVKDRTDEFIKSYNGEHWLDDKGNTLMTKCFVKRMALSDSSNDGCDLKAMSCKKGTVDSQLPLNRETFLKDDLNSLIEMNPPSFMPRGNVGTETRHFLDEIRSCRLPPSLITKLGLKFPRNRAKRMYSSVPFDYKRRGRNNNWKSMRRPPEENSRLQAWGVKVDDIDDKTDSHHDEQDSESEEEEWDRVESLHHDVSNQERNKERLFENKIELKWEKGGSGLVFYTDAQYWDKQDGDFDEKTADDWDIDTSIYTEPPNQGDKDIRDFIQMRIEKKLRDGNDTELDRRYDFAGFEKYNKRLGSKMLEAHGWKKGQGIGKNASGIAEPIPNEGQHPADKKGFGYHGEKLKRHQHQRRKRRDTEDSEDTVHISTIYDNPRESDPLHCSLASSSFAKLKYRKEFLKEHECDV